VSECQPDGVKAVLVLQEKLRGQVAAGVDTGDDSLGIFGKTGATNKATAAENHNRPNWNRLVNPPRFA